MLIMEKKALTKRQNEIFEYIKNFIEENSYSPSIRELCKGLKMSSTASVYDQLKKLEDKGYIKKSKVKFRSIEIIDDNQVKLYYIKKSDNILTDIEKINKEIVLPNLFNIENNSILLEDESISYILNKNYKENDLVLVYIDNKLLEITYNKTTVNVLGKILYKIEKK